MEDGEDYRLEEEDLEATLLISSINEEMEEDFADIKRLNAACDRTCLQILEGMEVDHEEDDQVLRTNNNHVNNVDFDKMRHQTDEDKSFWPKSCQKLTLEPQSSLFRGWADLGEFLVFILILAAVLSLLGNGLRDWYLRTTENSQDAIYPVLRTLRFTSLAFLQNFPSAPEYYEEACLFNNPFYEMTDVSCWPCENVRTLVDLTGFSNFTSSGYYQSGIPFIVKDAQNQKVGFTDIFGLLKHNGLDNLLDAPILQSSMVGVDSFQKILKWTTNRHRRNKEDNGKGLRVTWKVNRAQYARIMRALFQRPYYVPVETEVSVQHFLFVDQINSESYSLPITEFANVFLIQGEGPRLVILVPVRHCLPVCKPIKVLLQPRDVLYYNWLFWRPVMSPITTPQMVNQSSSPLSITYMGSFY